MAVLNLAWAVPQLNEQFTALFTHVTTTWAERTPRQYAERALLRRPELLILDETTSALDWENQTSIARAIEALRGAMTIVIIAHRPRMIAFADWVVALEDGKVIESGPYDELMQLGGSRLSQMQTGERVIRERR